MRLDAFTVIMAVLFSAVPALTIHLLYRRDFFLRSFGIHPVLFLNLLCILRMLLPVGFPFTIPVGVSAWDGLASLLNASLSHTAGNEYFIRAEWLRTLYSHKVWELLAVIWLAGAAVSLILFLAREFRSSRCLRRLPGRRNELAEAVLESIKAGAPRRLDAQIRVYQGLDMPMGVGLSRPLICLPDMDYTAKELSYILRHEYTHFLGRDLQIKLLVRLYVCLFWWNPAAWLLLGDIDQMLELRCDRAVTKDFTLRERREYLTVIMRSIMEAETRKSSRASSISTSLFVPQAQPEMLERFRLVADPGKVPARRNIVLTIFSLLLFAGSYAFVFQPTTSANRFTLPDGMVETLLLLAVGGATATWAWRKCKRAVPLSQRRLGALATAAAVLVTGLGVYQMGFQAGRVPVTASVTSWDGSRSSRIAIDTKHYDCLTSLDVHDVLCTSAALGVNPEGPYQYFSDVAVRFSKDILNDADTIIMAANCFEAVSAVPVDSVEYEPGFGPEFLMGDQALCGISDHYSQLTGLRMGDRVTLPIYTVSCFFYGEAYHYVGSQTLRVAAVYPSGQVDGLRTPDMAVPTDWLRDAAEGAGVDFYYSSLSAKLDNPRQAERVWNAGFVPVGTDDNHYRSSNTVTMLI